MLADTIKHYDSLFAPLDFEIVTERLPPMPLPKVVLEQFLHNGITNALKYALQEGIRPKLKFGGGWSNTGEPYWFLEDNGPGLLTDKSPAHDPAKAEQKKHKGQGIGLSKLREQLAFYSGDLLLQSGGRQGVKLVVTVHK